MLFRSIINGVPHGAGNYVFGLSQGLADAGGPAEYDWTLAFEVTGELIKSGVRPERITAAGRGMHKPLVPNTSPTNKAKNRRVEIILSPDYNVLIGRTNN